MQSLILWTVMIEWFITINIFGCEFSVLNLKNVSYNIIAKIELGKTENSGVIACQGGAMAELGNFLSKTGRLKFVYNWFGKEFTEVRSPTALAVGTHEIKINYTHDGGFGAGGLVKLFINGSVVDQKNQQDSSCNFFNERRDL